MVLKEEDIESGLRKGAEVLHDLLLKGSKMCYLPRKEKLSTNATHGATRCAHWYLAWK